MISNQANSFLTSRNQRILLTEAPFKRVTGRFERGAPARSPAPRIKKIPPQLRRRKPDYKSEPLWYKRWIWRLRTDSQVARATVQSLFALLCIWIGVEFYRFVEWGLAGGQGMAPSRPPGVEGFLPISGLISAKYWILSGIINTVHPAALFILLAIAATSIILKKSFCSWLCPIGTLSESLWMVGKKIFGRTFPLPGWADTPLRGIKYLLLGFFLWAIGNMDGEGLRQFIDSPYNAVADVKMFLFFAHMSQFALWTIGVLLVLSMIVPNFWCRFLCPYGALLGIVSFFSPFKITRNKASCVDCSLCTRACPAHIPVHRAGRVWSDECMSCMLCVEACPVQHTLDVRLRGSRTPMAPWMPGVIVVAAFVLITGLAIVTGHWKNTTTSDEYRHHFSQIDSPLYQHAQ